MKIVMQDGIKDCGVCCLLSVTRYYGGEISKELLREMTHTTKSGVSAYNLIEAMKKIGFDAWGMSGDMSKIEDDNLPCLAHVIINKKYKHFVVIYKINRKNQKVIIMDPAKGKQVLSFSQFKLLSSGNYIFLRPVKKLIKITKKNIITKLLKRLIKQEKITIIFISLLAFLYFVFQIILAFHFKYLLEFAINYKLFSIVYILSIYLFIIYIFKEISGYLRNVLLAKFINIVDCLLTFETYKQILLLPYFYYKNRTTGEVISRIRDLNLVKDFLAEVICFFITDFLAIFVFFIVLYKINKLLALFILFFSISFIFISAFFCKRRVKTIKKVSRQQEKINSYLVESLTNVDTIKGNHVEKRLFDVFLLKYKNLLDKSYNFNVLNQNMFLLKNIVNDLLVIIVFGVGSFLVIDGKFSLGELVVYSNILNYYLNSLYNVINIFNDYFGFKVALLRVEDLYLVNKEIFEGSYYYLSNRCDGSIKFVKLTYFIMGKKLFDNLSLEINWKEKVLLIGSSGEGKSSLVKILLRYIEIPYGMVSIKNIDINHYHLEVIRRNIMYISSNEFLFTNTLYNNITLEREVSEEEFHRVCKICQVDDLKDYRLGYQRLVEEDGFNFSNGERQRIVLARGLLKDADIYIFDEAFSQIDSFRRDKIINEIFLYLKDKTIIMISHNINSFNIFDKVLKLDGGRVCEIKKI